MRRILLYFAKYIKLILILAVILCIQVKFELMLPKYTSNIVDIGIQQSGIENSVPKIIDDNTYAMMLSLSDSKNKNKIARSYEVWDPNSNDKSQKEILNKNPNSKLISEKYYDKNYYLLKKDIKSDDIDSEMSDSLTRFASYMSSQGSIKGFKSFPLQELKNIPSYMKKQIGIKMVSLIYKNNGINTDKMQKNYLWKTGIVMVIMALFAGVVSMLVSFIASRISSGVAKELRSNIFRKVMSFSDYEMNKFSATSLIARSTNDIQQIQQSSIMALKFMFYGPIMALGAIVQVINLNASMIWIIALSVIVIIISIISIMYIALSKFKLVQKLVDKLNLVSLEFVSGAEVNRVFRTGKYEESRFDDVNKEFTKTNLFTSRLMFLLQPIMIFIMNATTLLIIWIGSAQVEKGSLQVGGMMAFMQYSIQIIMAFLFISMMSIILPRAITSANRIGEVLDCEISIEDNGNITNFNMKGEIEFVDVSFKYDGAEKNVIDDISFKANKGETIAIIGATGSGKSTIVNLMSRFLEVSDGKILLNGVDIKNIPMNLLREKVSVVSQKTFIFSGTIESNIEYARGIPRYKNMKNAAEISQAMDFINEKENKFSYKISQYGGNLSGGQRQRLAIARAIARDSEIIVFDDSFSALDSATDKKLRNSIKQNLSNKTMVIISQRINTIIDADKIIVIDDGKIKGIGTHSELLNNCDTYYDIARTQMTEEELKDEIRK